MKKTNNVGRIFLVIIAVAMSAVSLVAIAQHLFGVVAVFTAAVCIIPVCFAWTVWTNYKSKSEKLCQ